MIARLAGALALLLGVAAAPETPFEEALRRAEEALGAERAEEAGPWIQRALERDARSTAAWALRARAAELRGDRDEQVHARHVEYRLLRAQGAPKARLKELRADLEALDPLAGELLQLRSRFRERLLTLAAQYEKDNRPHSAIRVHQQVLALDPDHSASREAIERISARPDPSLAETATASDLFADVSEEWIRAFDAKHDEWERRATTERENYTTHTDAGYRVMLRAAEAMEQMNSFYREFFRYGTEEDGHSVPHISLRIFKNRDEYLEFGSSPAEWSGGQFTGDAVETYLGQGGFESMVSVLFHEAAHQFVGLATSAVGWLNEGLASFFEGCRIQANGTVLMNYPANHRLFPLARRMEQGWMTSANDGIDPGDPAASAPERAPTFRIVVENEYSWGPPWYAPTWGVVYFLYNFQDPVDGRFIYRAALRRYIDASGGKRGETAIAAFEETVLADPAPPTKGLEGEARPLTRRDLPRTIDELSTLWKDWIIRLRDEQTGVIETRHPYRSWARHAIARKELAIAQEHFEKGVVATPDDPEILIEFAEFLAEQRRNSDRASKLLLQALQLLDGESDEDVVRDVERRLARYDKRRRAALRIREGLRSAAQNLARRYLASERPLMAMEVSWRLGNQLGYPELFVEFEEAVRRRGSSLELWRVAYDERSLEGWKPASPGVWKPADAELHSSFAEYAEGRYDYDFLTLDEVTAGDFSLEAELLARDGEVAFAGLVFGRKDEQSFHAAVFMPGQRADPRYGKVARPASIDLTTFYGAGEYKIWRHDQAGFPATDPSADWHTLRVDVTGRVVDLWFDGEYVVSHEFPSTDVLQGSFGLFTGPGAAQWRDVRYIARLPRDPAARIQRELVLERLQAEAEAEGRRIGDSWIGYQPPWPEVAEWLQEPRAAWADRGPVPTLLVLWSIQQNELMPLHEWLGELAERHRASRLQIVSVASYVDHKALPAYLEEHPFPGSVGVDAMGSGGPGIIFGRYAVPKFNLPRLLLLDIDQKVTWEGDPGFLIGKPYKSGATSYVDDPLGELIERRKLDRLFPWLERWEAERGAERLAAGELVELAAQLREAAELDGAKSPPVATVQLKLSAVRAAIVDLAGAAQTLAERDARPVLDTLLTWAEALGQPVPQDEIKKKLGAILRHRSIRDWRKANEYARELAGKLAAARLADVERTAARLETLSGDLNAEFAARLRRALATGDLETVRSALLSGERIAAEWLAREYFRWE